MAGSCFRLLRRMLVPALLAAAVLAAGAARAQQQPDIALVLAVDVSRSIDEDEFRLQRRGYAEAFQNPAVITAIRATPRGAVAVAFVEWAGADYQRVVIPWTVISDSESGQLFAEQLLREPRSFQGWTSISGAIDYAVRLFDQMPYAVQRRVIDVSGDGMNNTGRLAEHARDEAVANGIVINGLPILTDDPNLDSYYRTSVIGGLGAFMLPALDFGAFAQAVLTKLLREVAAR
jgi:hypothetical protein